MDSHILCRPLDLFFMPSKKYKLFKASNGEKQAPCAFFSSPGGCKNGDNCRFLHERSIAILREDDKANLLELSSSNSSMISSESEDENHKLNKNKGDYFTEFDEKDKFVEKTRKGSRLKNTPCSHFSIGECRSGDKCRFLHELFPTANVSSVALEKPTESVVPEKERMSEQSASSPKKLGIKRRNDGDIFAAPKDKSEYGKTSGVKEADPHRIATSLRNRRGSKELIASKTETSMKLHNKSHNMVANPNTQKPFRETHKWQVAIDKTRKNPRYLSLYDFSKLKKTIGCETAEHSMKWINAKPFGNWCRKNPKVIAIACEMYKTRNLSTNEKHKMALCRISIVNGENFQDVLLDTLVKPEWPISYCHSKAMNHLEHVPFTVEHAQRFLSALGSQETVIVGHAVHDQLAAVRMDHQCVIDLSLLGDTNSKQSKTSDFPQTVKEFLNVEISRDCSTVEAAIAALRCLDVWLGRQD
jgi:RNA exonuclease 1